MLVLALDTTARVGSGAVARDGLVLHERTGDSGRPHDARLPGDLMALLDEAQVPLAAIDVYAVATGPGSFTGLRIGIATMQGLAFAAGKPLIGISAFDAFATVALPGPLRGTRPTGSPESGSGPTSAHMDSTGRVARSGPAGSIAVWIDAWRGEVFAARYQDGREVDPPSVARPETWLDRARDEQAPHVFIGGGAEMYRALIVERWGTGARIADPAAPPLAGTIARLATAAAQAGYRPPPDAIRPLYVRRPDAELARDARPVR